LELGWDLVWGFEVGSPLGFGIWSLGFEAENRIRTPVVS
jgi:hypothetical protein